MNGWTGYCIGNPTLGEDAEEFVDMFVTAVEEHRFENLKMLYLGRKKIDCVIICRMWIKELLQED